MKNKFTLRNKSKVDWYKRIMDNQCCVPGCSTFANHLHHIHPVGKNGKDEIINYFVCCQYHHYNWNNLHSKYKENDIELLTWKFMKEIELFGFCSADMPDKEFRAKINAILTKRIILGEFGLSQDE